MNENDKKVGPKIENIWRFIRGDLRVQDFEQWLYSDEGLEEMLGKTLYLDIISADYSDKDALFRTKTLLTGYARQAVNLRCKCIELSDSCIVNMGDESALFFEYVEEAAKRGAPYWWLSLDKCRKCNQWWLVAAEERQNDLYCLRRIDEQVAHEILQKNMWPNYFDKYETLLLLGYEAGIRIRFADPADSSLKWTIADLAKERPSIPISDIAKLLNIDIELAKELAKTAVKNEGVQIALDE